MSAPYAKWIYDIAIHLDEALSQGLAANAEHLFSLIPEGLRLVARGINDYSHLHNLSQATTQVMPLAQAPQAQVPAATEAAPAAETSTP